jgi:hypothetical protein
MDCSRWDMEPRKIKPDSLAHHGFGRCQLKHAATTTSGVYPRVCASFRPEKSEVVAVRWDWYNGKRAAEAQKYAASQFSGGGQ